MRIIIPSEKRQEISTELRQVSQNGHHKISKLLNDSTVSKFVTRKWIEVNDLSSSQYSVDKNVRFKTPC